MLDMGEKTEWFVNESSHFFLVQQIIFRLHIFKSYGTMLFDKYNSKFVASGNMAKKV